MCITLLLLLAGSQESFLITMTLIGWPKWKLVGSPKYKLYLKLIHPWLVGCLKRKRCHNYHIGCLAQMKPFIITLTTPNSLYSLYFKMNIFVFSVLRFKYSTKLWNSLAGPDESFIISDTVVRSSLIYWRLCFCRFSLICTRLCF